MGFSSGVARRKLAASTVDKRRADREHVQLSWLPPFGCRDLSAANDQLPVTTSTASLILSHATKECRVGPFLAERVWLDLSNR